MKDRLMEILDQNRRAYDLTELIPANGQNLDRLAMARQELRGVNKNVSALLEGLREEENHG